MFNLWICWNIVLFYRALLFQKKNSGNTLMRSCDHTVSLFRSSLRQYCWKMAPLEILSNNKNCLKSRTNHWKLPMKKLVFSKVVGLQGARLTKNCTLSRVFYLWFCLLFQNNFFWNAVQCLFLYNTEVTFIKRTCVEFLKLYKFH